MHEPLTTAQSKLHEAALRLFATTGANRVSVSELADAAGVARGTIYNNLVDVDSLFEVVAARLAEEMHQRASHSFQDVDDPAHRLAIGIRLFIRRANDEPHWGRFLARFGLSSASLRGLWTGPPMEDVLHGVSTGRYELRRAAVPSALASVGGAVLSTICLVLEGHQAWTHAGSDVAELTLRSLGIKPAEARRLARTKLPPLAAMTHQ
jgi:AcrR family transcriptional regulator